MSTETFEHSARSAMDALATFRRVLTRLNVNLLEREDFTRAQQLTSMLQGMATMEQRLLAVLSDESPSSTPGGAPGTGARSGAASKTTLNEEEFPRYLRRGEVIVKIGLRRDKTATYEQKLGRREFETIRDVLLPFAATGETFDPDRVIAAAGTPHYLVYLLLGVLQEVGAVESPTRGTYRFPHPLDASGMDRIWRELPAEEA